MSSFKFYKYSDDLPSTLEPNSIYLVRTSESTFDLYTATSNGEACAISPRADKTSPIFDGFPQLPNNFRINGVENFYQVTKPLARGDGSPLVSGDFWRNPTNGQEWTWNGTYWLSAPTWNSNLSPEITDKDSTQILIPTSLQIASGANPTWFLHDFSLLFTATQPEPSTDYCTFSYKTQNCITGVYTSEDVIYSSQGEEADSSAFVIRQSPNIAIVATTNSRLIFSLDLLGGCTGGDFWTSSVLVSNIYI
jgi:hypothetical protein